MDLAVIFVVYNRAVYETETAQALRKMKDAPKEILVYDNSETITDNRQKCAELGWNYLGGTGNVGLAKAYNACIDDLIHKGFDGVVSLFDDDTDIAEDYFSCLHAVASDQKEKSLFFPVLKAGGKIVSPQVIRPNQHASFYQTTEECMASDGTDRYAFNSGMAVRMNVFRQVRYDERLFLDGIDYAFLQECYRQGFSADVLPVVMEHGFSGTQRPEFTAAWGRFRHYATDYSIVLADNPKGYRYLVGKRALHLALIYKKFIFLRVFLHSRRYKGGN